MAMFGGAILLNQNSRSRGQLVYLDMEMRFVGHQPYMTSLSDNEFIHNVAQRLTTD